MGGSKKGAAWKIIYYSKHVMEQIIICNDGELWSQLTP
jgi:hypothetical protein